MNAITTNLRHHQRLKMLSVLRVVINHQKYQLPEVVTADRKGLYSLIIALISQLPKNKKAKFPLFQEDFASGGIHD
jgi:hypothetical protein